MRSSATVLLLISLFFAKFARSQSNELIIQGQTGKLYLEHTVVVRENWYSIGRLYNVTPKELGLFNNVALTQPLAIGQVLRIPLTATNFSQNGVKTPAETLIPLFHITQEKEWLYRISVNHNKVPIPSLEKWNKITPDQVHPGMHLIVGYLKVKTALSALTKTAATSAVATTVPAPAPPPVTKPATVDTTSTSKPPVVTKTNTATPPPPVPPVSAPASVTTTPTTTSAPPPSSAPTKPLSAAPAPAPTPPAPHFNGGAFRGDFNDGGKSNSGQAGVFKSTSGWQDGKYYALMNNTTVGTIVKVTDATSGKTIYAKVLGSLPEMKESAGLAIRISNAAAAELGESEGRFSVQFNY